MKSKSEPWTHTAKSMASPGQKLSGGLSRCSYQNASLKNWISGITLHSDLGKIVKSILFSIRAGYERNGTAARESGF
jgi:hypothetical protein